MEKDFVKRVLLNMNYDSSKTLNENEEFLLKESTSITWAADRDYELETLGPDYTLYKGGVFTSDNSDGDCPGPYCIATATAYVYWGLPRYLVFRCNPRPGDCSLNERNSIFDSCTTNSELESKLNNNT